MDALFRFQSTFSARFALLRKAMHESRAIYFYLTRPQLLVWLHRIYTVQSHMTCEIVLVGKPLFRIRSKAELDQRLSAFEKRF